MKPWKPPIVPGFVPICRHGDWHPEPCHKVESLAAPGASGVLQDLRYENSASRVR